MCGIIVPDCKFVYTYKTLTTAEKFALPCRKLIAQNTKSEIHIYAGVNTAILDGSISFIHEFAEIETVGSTKQ
jgi:hypothetical protein